MGGIGVSLLVWSGNDLIIATGIGFVNRLGGKMDENPKYFCHKYRCREVADRVHYILGVPVCEKHERSDPRIGFRRMDGTLVVPTVEGIGFRATKTARLSPSFGTHTWEPPEDITIVDPVNWCTACRKPVRAGFFLCRNCFGGLSEEEKARLRPKPIRRGFH